MFGIILIVLVALIFVAGINDYIPQYKVVAQKNSVKALSIDVGQMDERDVRYFSWHGLPIGIYKRSADEISMLSKNRFVFDLYSQKQKRPYWWDESLAVYVFKGEEPGWLNTEFRSISHKYFVFIRKTPVRGCNVVNSVFYQLRRRGRLIFIPSVFIDPCSNSQYDLAGRIFKNNLSNSHLLIPSYRFLNDNTIELYPNKEAINND